MNDTGFFAFYMNFKILKLLKKIFKIDSTAFDGLYKHPCILELSKTSETTYSIRIKLYNITSHMKETKVQNVLTVPTTNVSAKLNDNDATYFNYMGITLFGDVLDRSIAELFFKELENDNIKSSGVLKIEEIYKNGLFREQKSELNICNFVNIVHNSIHEPTPEKLMHVGEGWRTLFGTKLPKHELIKLNLPLNQYFININNNTASKTMLHETLTTVSTLTKKYPTSTDIETYRASGISKDAALIKINKLNNAIDRILRIAYSK